jgi:hypothetical protein
MPCAGVPVPLASVVRTVREHERIFPFSVSGWSPVLLVHGSAGWPPQLLPVGKSMRHGMALTYARIPGALAAPDAARLLALGRRRGCHTSTVRRCTPYAGRGCTYAGASDDAAGAGRPRRQ